MTVEIDPESHEIKALLEQAGSFTGQRVLEVGCGNGRLTWRYAGQATSVVAIDPNAEKIALAQENPSAQQYRHVDFRAVNLAQFASEYRESVHSPKFDGAILSWSL